MNARSPVILCVDDEETYLTLLEEMLVYGGYKVVGAASGKEALRKLKSQTIDLVLLDIAMPGMDGFEVCRQIKEDQTLHDIPIIIVTGLGSHKDRVRGIEAGVDDYFSKPFNQVELLARLKILLKMKKLNDERKLAEFQREAALAALQKSRDELEDQVRVRTAELAKANEMLQADIRERKHAEEALKESEAKYYDLYEKAPDMYYSFNLATGAIQECNETFLRTTGYRKEELIGRPIFDLFDADSVDDAKKSFQQVQATGEVRDAELRVRCKDGRIIDVSLNASAIRDKDGNIVCSRSIWRDITERKRNEEMIRALSITDQLTNLYNRRGFTTLVEQQLRVAERTKNDMLLLYADLDDLKKINDTLGHRSGDEAIVEASNVLKEVFRKMDIIARIGGDEFAVLAPEASLEHSEVIRHRLRNQIDIHNSREDRDYNLSLSIGMAYYDPSTPSSLDELISRADSLMYEQKRHKMALNS